MSILIKGMEMPETCIQCPMQFGGWCYVSPPEIDERVAPTVDEAVEQGKPDWCPLVEVPTPHGRLIDADKLFSYLDCESRTKYPIADGKQYGTLMYYEIFDDVDNAPTIIEAEE